MPEWGFWCLMWSHILLIATVMSGWHQEAQRRSSLWDNVLYSVVQHTCFCIGYFIQSSTICCVTNWAFADTLIKFARGFLRLFLSGSLEWWTLQIWQKSSARVVLTVLVWGAWLWPWSRPAPLPGAAASPPAVACWERRCTTAGC